MAAEPKLDPRGLKRICTGCGNRFYDLNKRPIICPSCDVEFTGEIKVKSRRGRVAANEAAEGQVSKKTAKDHDAEDDDLEDDDGPIMEDDDDDDDTVSLDDLDEDDDDDDDDIDLDLDDDLGNLDDIEPDADDIEDLDNSDDDDDK